MKGRETLLAHPERNPTRPQVGKHKGDDHLPDAVVDTGRP